ncbi:MAG TPA: TonB-dependent receptor [Candidatus Dormibacteraeota bacterium]|nr:TonB-dependent receptor [Candidatus Dormibacteraeota bacterium]
MRKRALAVALLIGFLPILTLAQVAITGKITGVVTDSSGGVIPNATVTVTGAGLMTSRSASTQSDGSYLFDLLPPATYKVSITASGFKTFVQNGVVITAGFTATVDGHLQVGAVSQEVTVSGAAPVVDTKGNETETTFDQSLLQDIPSGRDPWSTVAQAPGTTVSTVDVGGNQSYQQSTMQVHGSTPGEQMFSFNGLDLNWPGANGGYTQFYTDHDSFEEFQVVTDNAPASVPIGGIYMNMVTKSGSNQWHGQAAAYYATAAFEAGAKAPIFNGSPVNAASPILHDRDTSIGVGGPIFKDKLWIFGSYRRYDIRESILAVRLPNGDPIPDTSHQTNTALRLDWQINSKNRLGLIWLYNEQNRFQRRDTSYQFVSQDASWLQIEPAYILEALWTSQLTSNFLIDTRFGYNKEVFPLSYAPGVPPTAINVTDVSLSTETGAAPFAFVNPAWVAKFASTASYYKAGWGGAHNLKFGFEVGKALNPYVYSVNQGITEQFNNGTPSNVSIYNTPFTVKTYFRDSSVFVQDAWSIKRRLTLNLGVRYDHFNSYYPAESIAASPFYPTQFPAQQFPASGNLVDWNNVSPRLGVAYDLTGHGTQVIRASFDRYYLMEGTQLVEAVNPDGFSTVTYNWNGATNSNGVPTGFLGTTPIAKSGGVFTHVDPNLKRPYSDEVSVSYEKQLWRDLRVGAAYYYRGKGNLLGQTNLAATPADYSPITTLNGQPIVNPLTNQPMTLYSLNPSLVGATNNLITNISALDTNTYNGVEFTATKRLSQNFQLLTGFTIQRQRGVYGAGGSDEALGDNFNDPNLNINRQNNYLNMDSTYVFKLDGTYNLPKGFALSANFQHYTGFPIRPTAFFQGPELAQGNEIVALLPAGAVRYPSVNLLNLRVSREFAIGDRIHVEPLIDLFNITNAQTVVSENTFVGPGYLQPSNTVNPFLARIGMRVTF